MHVHLEPLGREHLEFVRGLRNALRNNFFNTEAVTEWQQAVWYEQQYMGNCNILIWVIYYDSKPVGTISRKHINRIILDEVSMTGVYEIGNLMLLPNYQRKGIMQEAMRQVTALGTCSFYVAYVKPNNSASLRCFKNAGFWRVPKKRKRKR